MFTPIEIVLAVIIVWISILWGIDQYRWAKRNSELLDRIMAKNFQEYVLGEQARVEMKKKVEIPSVNTDILPIT